MEKWLNGYTRRDSEPTMLLGAMVVCVGCGKNFGITTVAVEPDYVAPEKLPDFPFEQEACPVCALVAGRTADAERATQNRKQYLQKF